MLCQCQPIYELSAYREWNRVCLSSITHQPYSTRFHRFCLRGAIASTTSDFVFKFRAIFALTQKDHTVDIVIVQR